MKKFFAVLLTLTMCLFSAAALCETASTPAEGEIEMHKYISKAANYFVGVPVNWALVGAYSTPENLAHAKTIMDPDDVDALYATLGAENDILFAFSAAGEQMVLNYGSSDGITADTLIDEMGDLKRLLEKQYPGIKFVEEQCGSYTLKEVYEVLHIRSEYKGNRIDQYYVPAGETIYIFTFVNVTDDVYQVAVLSSLTLDVE